MGRDTEDEMEDGPSSSLSFSRFSFPRKQVLRHLDSDSPVALSCLGVHVPFPLSEVPQFDRF